jgi:hypothetical protein
MKYFFSDFHHTATRRPMSALPPPLSPPPVSASPCTFYQLNLSHFETCQWDKSEGFRDKRRNVAGSQLQIIPQYYRSAQLEHL